MMTLPGDGLWRRLPSCRVLGIGLAVSLVFLAPGLAFPELRPLVRDMLENLGAVEQIGQGVALEDYASVRRAAQDLKRRAVSMKSVDHATRGLAPNRDSAFDAYLTTQAEAADAIDAAARAQDGQAAMLGVQQLFQNACLGCHNDFRKGSQRLKSSVLFMTTYMDAWKDMNRGLAIDDLALVGRSAREVLAMTRVLSWDQVIQTTFGLQQADRRKAFRLHLSRLGAQASRIEQASVEQDVGTILRASRQMWNQGCLACHEEFR